MFVDCGPAYVGGICWSGRGTWVLGVAECELDYVFECMDEGGYCLVVDVEVVGHGKW